MMEDHLEGLILGLWQGSWLEDWKQKNELRRLSVCEELIVDFSSNFYGLVKIVQSSLGFIWALFGLVLGPCIGVISWSN